MWLMAVHVGVGVAADCATSPGACLAKGASLLQMRSLNMRSARQIKQASEWLAPQGHDICASGKTPTEATCKAVADKLLASLGKTPGRATQAGSWPHVPVGCSVLSRGDWTVHFNRLGTGTNDGGYSLVCQKAWCLNGSAKTAADGTLYCCAGSCGTCGDDGCSERPGGGNNCCGDKLNRTCESVDDTVCKVPPTQA